ncbi:hypothetical protein [Opitutus sp. ER46]|uniref:hypothetical protein n=1 Tax=Opitutus sp. ER46 TaxID=2161864 RepID=UPI0011B1DC1B|nr:hypothetical protein [Opitutus sp. ER46]
MLLPWFFTVVFAAAALVVGFRYETAQAEYALLEQTHTLTELELKRLRAQLEAERILAAKLAADYDVLKAAAKPTPATVP